MNEIEYLRGLDAAVSSGVEYGLELVSLRGPTAPPPPLPVLTQARVAARHRIPLNLVLRRYLAARTVIHDFVLKAALEPPALDPASLQKALGDHNSAFDRLVTLISEEYEREISARYTARTSQHADLIHRLLLGEPADDSSLGYSLDGYHLGLVVLSPDPQPLLRSLSKEIDARFLTTRPSESATWAWLGGNEAPDPAKVFRWADKHWPASTPLGIGEVAPSLSGWRRTHRQAQAAASVAHLASRGVTKYRDVVLLSAAYRDPLLLESLRDMYLTPLGREGHRGEVLRRTLRAFFDASRNSSCAAVALGVSRQTISKRLQVVEERLDQPLTACGDLLDAALQLDDMTA